MQSPNFLHLMMASNENWVVPASLEARRFFVLEVSDKRVGDQDYFDAIIYELEHGGYEAMLHELLIRDISRFNVRTFPKTDALMEQKRLSLPTEYAWWMECLQRGYVFESECGLDEELGVWMEKISTDLLHASYMAFAKERQERRPLTRESLGKFMVSVGCEWGRLTKVPVGEYVSKVRKVGTVRIKPRATGYHVGSLIHAAINFQMYTGIKCDWEQFRPKGENDDPEPEPESEKEKEMTLWE